jgi:hypothetical protein
LSKWSPASLNLGELPNLDIGEPATDSSKNILFFWKVLVVGVDSVLIGFRPKSSDPKKSLSFSEESC